MVGPNIPPVQPLCSLEWHWCIHAHS